MCRKETKFGLFLIKLSFENGESVWKLLHGQNGRMVLSRPIFKFNIYVVRIKKARSVHWARLDRNFKRNHQKAVKSVVFH